jgi:hypothetical protein
VAEGVEHWFNRRYKDSRRDVYLLRAETGWQVVNRKGGADGEQITHYFDREDQERAMLVAMPLELSDCAEMKIFKHGPPSAAPVSSAIW